LRSAPSESPDRFFEVVDSFDRLWLEFEPRVELWRPDEASLERTRGDEVEDLELGDEVEVRDSGARVVVR
jgi:hypothetical protein